MAALDEAIADRQTALTEYAAKQFLAGYGIPVPREALANRAAPAAILVRCGQATARPH